MILTKVLQGTLYDVLQYPFHQHQQETGAGNIEYIPIQERRPSVRYNLPKLLVDDSVSLLFSEGHFPEIDTDEKTEEKVAKDTIKEIIKDSKLNLTMFDAATRGSVGSVAILMKIFSKQGENRVYFDVLETTYLTPTFDPLRPDEIESVKEKYKISRDDLLAQGYTNLKPNVRMFWFQRIWDAKGETWYIPWPAGDDKATPQVDALNSVEHDLGFCPIVWIKNLPGTNQLGSVLDGACTFYDAIDGSIEIDYQLSQGGTGLRYSSDPTLVLMTDKKPSSVKKNSALVLPIEADAKLLEINGDAAGAVLEYVRELRQMMIEQCHGNRAHADKITAAQSGRAIELMNQALIWLADRLRISYGESGLIKLMAMVIAAHAKKALTVQGQLAPAIAGPLKLSLKWPPYVLPTAQDLLSQASTLKALKDAGLMSVQRAVETLAPNYDIEDVQAELSLIEADRAKFLAEEKPMVTETVAG